MTKQEEIREGIIKLLKLHEARLEDIKQEERTAEGYIISEEDNRNKTTTAILKLEDSQGVVIKVDRELPKKLTNNIGCMSKGQIEAFADMVLRECGYPHRMEWTTAGDILIGEIIYIDERHINEYPYMAKERVLHEIAHIDTWPQDQTHGELFHRRLAELINRFMAGYVAVEPLV